MLRASSWSARLNGLFAVPEIYIWFGQARIDKCNCQCKFPNAFPYRRRKSQSPFQMAPSVPDSVYLYYTLYMTGQEKDKNKCYKLQNKFYKLQNKFLKISKLIFPNFKMHICPNWRRKSRCLPAVCQVERTNAVAYIWPAEQFRLRAGRTKN